MSYLIERAKRTKKNLYYIFLIFKEEMIGEMKKKNGRSPANGNAAFPLKHKHHPNVIEILKDNYLRSSLNHLTQFK